MLSSIGSLVVYHVTPTSNIPSIMMHGVDPRYSNCQMPVCWYVSRQHIFWAILHISVTYQLLPDELSVCTCDIPAERLTRWMTAGRYHSKFAVMPESIVPAIKFAGEPDRE